MLLLQPSELIDNEEEYEIEEIVDRKMWKKEIWYKVK